MPTQSPVALAISSPTFFGDKPRGPILGASADEAPTSPPVARRWLWSIRSAFPNTNIVAPCFRGEGDCIANISTYITLTSLGSNLGAIIWARSALR
ncbi:hypothetical protein F5Y04DRAFT_176933 [Hypomontagnella monticulosa]|nr:hypothetical protein F5Y04DRAFT_176933 [Hypomontagnella monticulosa]